MEVQRFSGHHPLVKSWLWVWGWQGRWGPPPPAWSLTSCHTVGDWYHPVHKPNYSTTLKERHPAMCAVAGESSKGERLLPWLLSLSRLLRIGGRAFDWLFSLTILSNADMDSFFLFSSLSQMLLLCNSTRRVCTSLNSGCYDFHF